LPNPDRRLLQLLEPILRDHGNLVEAVLPDDQRSNWRQAIAFLDRYPGRKSRDDRDLLLAMAEMDHNAPAEPQDLAVAVVARFPVEAGAGHDERRHVRLPDGSCPALKDLIARLARKYAGRRDDLQREVAKARGHAARMARHAEQIRRGGTHLPSPGSHRRPASKDLAHRLREAERLSKDGVTAHQLDSVLAAIRKPRGGS
jgi:hypothetical protein